AADGVRRRAQPAHPARDGGLDRLTRRSARARAGRLDPRAAVPAAAALGQLPAAGADQARAPDAGRVLGLLLPQLAAHAAIPEGVARALRRPRAAHDRRTLPRL